MNKIIVSIKHVSKKGLAYIVSLAMILSMVTGIAVAATSNVSAASDTESYIIENTSKNTINVTIKHVLASTSTSIYSTDSKELEAYNKINNYKKATNYDIDEVDVGSTVYTDKTDFADIKISADAVVTVKYAPKTTTSTGNVSFYDYFVNPGTNKSGTGTETKSINTNSNYSSSSTASNRFGISTYSGYENTYLNSKAINKYTGGTGNDAIKDTIISGMSSDYKTINFNSAISAPGVFSNDAVNGKVNRDGYTLQFSQSGDTYNLASVKNANGTTVCSDMSNFFPLDEYYSTNSSNANFDGGNYNNHDYYFGMRYDISFSLGDYTGNLNYSFTGDDDLWVLLDGKVVLDIGGIHDAITRNVNLWTALNNQGIDIDNLTSAQKSATHRLTVLYMERGAGLSNCHMKYTIPNAKIIDVSNTPKANLTVKKTDTAGKGLANAKFTLNDGSNTETIYSDASGNVKLTDLLEGEYTLKEIAAPDGYELSDDYTYKVKVTVNNGVATAKLYKSDGTTLISDDTITNESTKEKVLKSVTAKKTSNLVNWNDRTYQIKLSASSQYTSTSVIDENNSADIMMVLDRSGSMKWPSKNRVGLVSECIDNLDKNKTYYIYTNEFVSVSYNSHKKAWGWDDPRYGFIYLSSHASYMVYTSNSTSSSAMENLKTAATGFVSGLSSVNRIGVASFSGTSGTTDASLDYATSDYIDTVNSSINSLSAYGGTSPAYGLQEAYDELNNDTIKSDGKKKVVILFTDGMPTGNSDQWNDTAASNTKDKIDALKKLYPDITIYTVGLNLTEKTSTWLSGLATSGNAIDVTDASKLAETFKNIQQQITSTKSVTNVSVTDVVSKEFELTAEQKAAFANNSDVSVTYNDDGTTTVTWKNQEIKYNADGAYTWNNTIDIKAKSDYIGGNNVATNDDCYLTIKDIGKKTFTNPTPEVNVKIDLDISDDKQTLFSGETYDGTDSMKNMFSTSGTFTKVWSTDKTFTDSGKLASDADMLKKITDDEVLYLRVGYKTEEANATATSNSTVNGVKYSNASTVYATNKKNNNNPYGILTVNFLKGKLDITKTIDEQYTTSTYGGLLNNEKYTNNIIHSDQTFIFKITRSVDGETKETFYQTISFDSSENKLSKTVTIHNLKKGTYKVTEETMWSAMYSLVNVSDSTNGETTDFQLGGSNLQIGTKSTDTSYTGLDDDTGESKYTGYSSSKKVFASFTNHKKTWAGWNSDSASSTNTYGSN